MHNQDQSLALLKAVGKIFLIDICSLFISSVFDGTLWIQILLNILLSFKKLMGKNW